MVSAAIDDDVVVVVDVVTLRPPNINDFAINLSSEIDSVDDCDKPDTVNAETVDAELSIWLIVLLPVSKMHDESSDAVDEFG